MVGGRIRISRIAASTATNGDIRNRSDQSRERRATGMALVSAWSRTATIRFPARNDPYLNNRRKISSELSVYFTSLSGPTKFSGTPAVFGTTPASDASGGTAGSAGERLAAPRTR